MNTSRFWEIVPGAAAWTTLLGLVVLSAKAPIVVALFIVLFDVFWLLKTFYLFFHLKHSFRTMRENMRVNWLDALKKDTGEEWRKIHHLVIFPMYQEPYEVVRKSFEWLSKTNYPKSKLLIILALEERGGIEDQVTAIKIEEEFRNTFGALLITHHPDNLPGELRGKGSNQAWAAREAKKEIIDAQNIGYEKILVSIFDVDTRPEESYFGILAHKFLTTKDGDRASYQPIPLFTNNIYNVSFFARLLGFTASFWQFMQQARPEQLTTFSSHSMPWKALHEIGFWHTNVVSEDSRIFFQCLHHYKGNWRVEPLLYPVCMDAVGGTNFWDALKNIYKQQRRWAWGVENFAYMMRTFVADKTIPAKIKKFWVTKVFDGFYSWSTASLVIFLFGWLPNILGGEAFRETMLSHNLPEITSTLMKVSMIGIATSAFLSLFLLPPHPKKRRLHHYLVYLLEWACIPFTLIIFSSIPSLDAQTRLMAGGKLRLGFWRTPKSVITKAPVCETVR